MVIRSDPTVIIITMRMKPGYHNKCLWLGYKLGNRWVVTSFLAQTRYFSLLPTTQTSSGFHPASYTMGTGGCVPGCEAAHSPPSNAEVKGVVLYLHSQYAYVAWTVTILPCNLPLLDVTMLLFMCRVCVYKIVRCNAKASHHHHAGNC
jgi:hypothetical protein